MFEFLFFVTAVYMGYVAYEAYQAVDRAEKGEPVFKEPAPKSETKPAPKPATPLKAASNEVASQPIESDKTTTSPAPKKAVKPASAKPKETKAASKPAPAKATSSEKATLSDSLKNPETGEVTAVPVNYRFAKKWIKDALVSEGFLDRVYKPNELDDATSKKVKDAIDKMRATKKYQA